MSHRILLVVALALFAGSCDQQPVAPEGSQGSPMTADFAHAGTPFTGTATIQCPPGSIPGTEKTLPTGQVMQMNRHVYYDFASSDPRLTGESEWWVNKKIEADNTATKIWGKIELVADGDLGVWDLSFHGYRVGIPPRGTVTLEAIGQGKTGEVKGLITKLTMIMPTRPPCLPPPNGSTPGRIFTVAGDILDK